MGQNRDVGVFSAGPKVPTNTNDCKPPLPRKKEAFPGVLCPAGTHFNASCGSHFIWFLVFWAPRGPFPIPPFRHLLRKVTICFSVFCKWRVSPLQWRARKVCGKILEEMLPPPKAGIMVQFDKNDIYNDGMIFRNLGLITQIGQK